MVDAHEKAKDILDKSKCTLGDLLLPNPHKYIQDNYSLSDLNKNYPLASQTNDLCPSPTL